jgi:4,5-DOPA dioxygenase extradiol
MMMNTMNGVSKIHETFYISHGSPTLSIDETMPARHFLQSFQQKVYSPRPSSILVISGHWETTYPTVNVVSDGPNDTIYDFYNFPKKMYQVLIITHTLLRFIYFLVLQFEVEVIV